ncbi:MAG: enoyl-CoA hydratase-related protein [Bacteroidia bacterium]
MISTHIDTSGIATLTWDLPGGANILNQASVSAFSEALEAALADPAVKGIVVASAKDTFIVGGDLKALYALSSVDEVLTLGRGIHKVFRRMETGANPWSRRSMAWSSEVAWSWRWLAIIGWRWMRRRFRSGFRR